MVGGKGWAALIVTAALAAGCSDDGSANGDGDGSSDGTGAATDATVHVLSQNLLHGITCPPDTDGCELPARVRLFARQLADGGCPQLVSIQEANQRTVELLGEALPTTCGGDYEIVADADEGLDREVVLTTLPVLGQQRVRLAGPLRTALWVRVAADVGVVDFVSTHLASSADDRPCDATTCPPPCTIDETVNTCQARQVLAFAEEVADPDSVVLIGGDLNAEPGDPTLAVLTEAGFVDTHVAAGNPECDTATGAQCTSGRADEDLSDLTDPASRQSERIDYLLVGGRACDVVDPTGLFNAEPADPPEEGSAASLVFPSDHTGVDATLSCPTTEQQREEAASATVTTAATTTTAPATAPDDATRAAITESFRTLFDGDVSDVEVKLAALEDGEILRPFFLASYEAQAAIAPRIRVRIDDVGLTGPDRAEVTYSLLLDGAPVLDHLAGEAVLVNGRWLVSRRTYCEVSTQGATEIPPPCQ